MESLDGDLPITQRKLALRRLETSKIRVKKAGKDDVAGIFKVAASVGTENKDSYKGFLMDDYSSDPNRFMAFFGRMVKELDYFYVAREKEVVGFLMAYTRKQWLKANPEWLETVNWAPAFDRKKTDNFVLVDKIAILKGATGKGVGSQLYKRFIKDLKKAGIEGIFSETIIYPTPNFASLSFRKKQGHELAGTRFEVYEGEQFTDAIYYKPVES